MNLEILKISKIVEEVIDFFFSQMTKKINISIEEKENSYIIEIYSDQIVCSENKLKKFNELLHVQRQREMDEYYWQLAGNDFDGDEYNLVGMMVDEAQVEYNKPILKIKLVRYK